MIKIVYIVIYYYQNRTEKNASHIVCEKGVKIVVHPFLKFY